MILLVNMGQENERRNRNEKPQSVEDGERVADSNLCQRGKQHQYRAEQNSHTAIRGCRTHTCLNHTTFQGWNSGWHLERPVEACRQLRRHSHGLERTKSYCKKLMNEGLFSRRPP